MIKYEGIGATLVFTALLAWLSSFYAFSFLVEATVLQAGMATLWAGMIFNLDRFIVSSMRKRGKGWAEWKQAIPRILLAIMLAFIISRPLELRLFRQEINQVLAAQALALSDSLDRRHAAAREQVQQEENQLKQQLQVRFEQKEAYYHAYRCECDGTCGTGIKGRGSECARKEAKYREVAAEFNAFKAETDGHIHQLKEERKRIAAQRDQEEVQLLSGHGQGLLARLQALHALPGWGSLAILLLLIFIETAPVLTKILAPRGPYDHLLLMRESQYKAEYVQSLMRLQHQQLRQESVLREEVTSHDARIRQDARQRATERQQRMNEQLRRKLRDSGNHPSLS